MLWAEFGIDPRAVEEAPVEVVEAMLEYLEEKAAEAKAEELAALLRRTAL